MLAAEGPSIVGYTRLIWGSTGPVHTILTGPQGKQSPPTPVSHAVQVLRLQKVLVTISRHCNLELSFDQGVKRLKRGGAILSFYIRLDLLKTTLQRVHYMGSE